MTPARLRTIEEIFHSALDRPAHEIGSFLDASCQGDELLRAELDLLLTARQEAGHFIETPAIDLAAKIGQPELLMGQRIGHYELLRRIGAGGMGEVYLATDVTAGRQAALKLLPARFTGNTERRERFAREAHAVVALNHPNIVTTYEIGEDRSTHYIASELVDGETLCQRLARAPMIPEEAVDVAIQAASALVAAHEAGIVHRDIKPENIMLRPDGYVKVLDFGIAKLAAPEVPSAISEEDAVPLGETHVGSIFGTARYMSPEQVRGEVVDKRTDIWSLGAVLYEMVARRAPFNGASAEEVMTSILETEPPPLTNQVGPILVELGQIIRRTLHKEADERYQSARELLEALKSVHRRMDLSAESDRKHWIRSPAAVVLAMLTAILALTFPFYWQRNETIPAPEKSIAVLPFENLSENNEHASFGAGIQDDLLTSLAQIHDLKVISRTSVMAYQKSDGRNIREIGQTLGAANVLEGSVRREGNRVLVAVQLIDARNDRHLWAERYDRTVADSIGLQGELATQIAAALKATLLSEEKARLDAGPTTNSEAYVLYLTALGKEGAIKHWPEDAIAAEQLYVQATAVDPTFALAHARASLLNSSIASYEEPRARKARARAQAEEALRLSPTLGEGHMALGLCLYWGEKKYDAALKEFDLAAASSPNNAEIYTYIGGIYRRQGRWREAVASFERALPLDPRNARIAFRAADNELYVRDWPRAIAGFNRVLKIAPDADSKIALAYLEVVRNGNPVAGRKILQNIPPGIDPDERVTLARWDLAMLERDYATAEKIVTDSPLEDSPWAGYAPKTFYQGRTALARGDIESAQRYFAAARPEIEKGVRDDPTDPEHQTELGLLYAYMHRKEDAMREARRAVELEPESQDAFHGPRWAGNLALVYALVGEQDQAIALIERLLSTPGPVSWADSPSNMTLADLRLRWEWDSLRSNPRFQKILAGPEPKTALRSGP
jgi:serine/threonine protein kinase/Flp pilus assembly protein TadD